MEASIVRIGWGLIRSRNFGEHGPIILQEHRIPEPSGPIMRIARILIN